MVKQSPPRLPAELQEALDGRGAGEGDGLRCLSTLKSFQQGRSPGRLFSAGTVDGQLLDLCSAVPQGCLLYTSPSPRD